MTTSIWPELKWTDWQETADTLHMWTQIVGKTRLALSPLQAHWWNVPLYVSARGLNTSAMPYGSEFLEITFDFVSHELKFFISTGASLSTPLRAQSVAEFYREYQRSLAALGVTVNIYPTPVEVQHPIPFAEDEQHSSYDPEAAHRFWQVLMRTDQVFQQFSSRFVGKVSPVHFFWGSFDLAVTRFSGRSAPKHPGGVPNLPDAVACEAYSHEVSSAGFWPGSGAIDYPAFYSYAYPEPAGYRTVKVRPAAASFSEALGEFILPYDAVRAADNPDRALLEFLQSTYEAAANAAKWDREALECEPGQPQVVRPV
jgi:hypothetical protein